IRAAVAQTSRIAPETRSDGGEEDHARSALKRCEAYATPQVPPGAPLAGAKRSALRLLRFLWRDQSAYNALMLESANELVAAVAGQRRRLEEVLLALVRSEEKLGRWLDAVERWREASERREAIRDGRLTRLEEGAGPPVAAVPADAGSA